MLFRSVVTRIYIEPDPKSQYKVRFEMLELLPNELYPVIRDRHLTLMSQPERGYDPPDVQAAQRQSGALAGLRRPGA